MASSTYIAWGQCHLDQDAVEQEAPRPATVAAAAAAAAATNRINGIRGASLPANQVILEDTFTCGRVDTELVKYFGEVGGGRCKCYLSKVATWDEDFSLGIL